MQITIRFATVCALILAGAANAAEVQFAQQGWSSPGATLAVSFSGSDENSDGVLSASELTAFQATWSSPLLAASAAWGLNEIQPDGLFFSDLNNYLFFLTNSEFSLVSTAFEGEALASLFDALLFPVDSSLSPAILLAPEPEGLALLAVALALVARWARRSNGNNQGEN